MSRLLDGKRCLVAGVGPGLGKAIVEALVAEGAAVGLLARNRNYLEEVAEGVEAAGGSASIACADLTDRTQVNAAVATVGDAMGGIDTIIYNAYSAGEVRLFEDVDLDEWRSQMAINLFGALELVQAALPHLSASQGSVVLINSRQVRSLGQSRGGYAISKAALLMAGQVLAKELGSRGIRVNTVVPGWMWGAPVQAWFDQVEASSGVSADDQYAAVVADFALPFIPQSSMVAQAVVFLASDRAAAITGQSLDVNAGEVFH